MAIASRTCLLQNLVPRNDDMEIQDPNQYQLHHTFILVRLNDDNFKATDFIFYHSASSLHLYPTQLGCVLSHCPAL